MISVALKPSTSGAPPEEIVIDLDGDGLLVLIAQLECLRNRQTDHIHLMSEAWGGSDLVDLPKSQGYAVIHHMKIQLYGASSEFN
jgi:hypothetical protein